MQAQPSFGRHVVKFPTLLHRIPCGHCSCTNPDHEVEIRALRQQLSVLAEDSTALTLRARAISIAAILPLGQYLFVDVDASL